MLNMKTLYIISKGMAKLSQREIIELEQNGELPRFTYLEKKLAAVLLDERFLREKTPAFLRYIYKLIPVAAAQILEALRIQHQYDLILTQTEKVSLPLAFFMRFLRMKTPHILIISRITSIDPFKSKLKIWYLKRIKHSVTRFLIWSSNQRKIAIEKLGINPEKIVLIKRGTDQRFWEPIPGDTDMICSVGMEARDYPTLVEALRPLSIPCHLAVGESRGELFDTIKKLYEITELPSSVSVGRKNYKQLKELYARSRFTVVSLLPTDSDNGLTAILESMAMGKPVICTKTEGQIDIIQDGVTGIIVPQGDPEALRKAITDLWNAPEKCVEMGKEARKYIEKHHTLEQFAEAIIQEADTVLQENKVKNNPSHSLQMAQSNVHFK